jgi:hypothetical protein
MAVTSAKTENAGADQSPSRPVSVSDSASQTSSLDDPSDHSLPDHLNLSPVSSPQLELQHQPSSRSEEYRQLFRLPPEEVLVQDFNCALQENFLLQGHMYLFVHYICFYSNLFGFENKKMIHFQEITALRRAKTAGIFPTAIELIAGERKFFFTSFLSRDEAYKLIYDGWLMQCNGAKAIADQQVVRDFGPNKDHIGQTKINHRRVMQLKKMLLKMFQADVTTFPRILICVIAAEIYAKQKS